MESINQSINQAINFYSGLSGNRRCLNTVNDEAEVTCCGSVFQMRAPATGKAREPMEVSQTAGTIRLLEVEERSWSTSGAG